MGGFICNISLLNIKPYFMSQLCCVNKNYIQDVPNSNLYTHSLIYFLLSNDGSVVRPRPSPF